MAPPARSGECCLVDATTSPFDQTLSSGRDRRGKAATGQAPVGRVKIGTTGEAGPEDVRCDTGRCYRCRLSEARIDARARVSLGKSPPKRHIGAPPPCRQVVRLPAVTLEKRAGAWPTTVRQPTGERAGLPWR